MQALRGVECILWLDKAGHKVAFGESIARLRKIVFRRGCEARRKYLSTWTLDGLLLLGGDLNPNLGFYFPLFSMVFPRRLPSGWKMADFSGSKTAANCCKSTYLFYFGYVRLKLRSARRVSGYSRAPDAKISTEIPCPCGYSWAIAS
jgi:hypothetical protein